VPAKIVAIANDTVGTQMTQAYQDKNAEVGVILGTGTNACYTESMHRIKKLYGTGIKPKGEGGMIINMEWGAFCDLSPHELPLTQADVLLDKNSINPGLQRFEKMISGMYLGEIVRYRLIELVHSQKLFGGNVPESLSKEYSFETAWMSTLARDSSSVDGVLTENLKIQRYSASDKEMLLKACREVASRAARLSAVAIISVLTFIDKINNVTVAVDGSLYEHYPGFSDLIRDSIKQLYPESDITLTLTKDGSGIGAAVIAAVAK